MILLREGERMDGKQEKPQIFSNVQEASERLDAIIENSFDGGRTWTACDTDGATADKWVNWQFTASFEEKGDYEMTVRARTADDVVSPLSASLAFAVR